MGGVRRIMTLIPVIIRKIAVCSWSWLFMGFLLVGCGTQASVGSAVDDVPTHFRQLSEERIAQFKTRWFPRSARFAPDESHLIVSMCHFMYSYYCHLARYWIADARWEVLPFVPDVSAGWPDYSPDGKRIVFAQAACISYHCDWGDFKLATMNSDGSGKQVFDTHGAQMPAFAPDGERMVYWGLVGRAKLSSGRGVIAWDVYEYDPRSPPETREQKVTASLFDGIWTGPRYMPDGERLFFTGYIIGNDGSRTFVIPRKLNLRPNYKNDLPGRRLQRAGYVHAYHPELGWLVSASLVWLIPPGHDAEQRDVFNAYPYSATVADISRSGRWAVSIQGASEGTMARGGIASYLNDRSIIGASPVPVMTLANRETGSVSPLFWPADMESLTLSKPN